MQKIFIELIKAIWPFLRESWFQGDSVIVWVRKHKVIMTWLILIIVLSISDLILIRELSTEKLNHQLTRTSLATLQNENKLLKQQLNEEKLKSSKLAVCENNLSEVNVWLESCSLIESFDTRTCPAPKTIVEYKYIQHKSTRPSPKPQSRNNQSEEKPKETFREKLKRIFGRGENRS